MRALTCSRGCAAMVPCYGTPRFWWHSRAPCARHELKAPPVSRAWRPSWTVPAPAELPSEHSGVAGNRRTCPAWRAATRPRLFELALETECGRCGQGRSRRFEALLTESADLPRLVRSPVFSAEEQVRALCAVLDLAGVRGLSAQFLLTVASNRRLFAVRDMIKAYRQLVARHRGEVAPR